jgi:diguanylate cyclase (GGDEF)-like protein
MVHHDFLQTETLQLGGLQAIDLVDTPLDARFNRLARLARQALRVPVAAISLIDNEREWFKAVAGWNVVELPRAESLSARLVEVDGPVLVADALQDERIRSHSLVTRAPRFRFCAVYPLQDRFERVLGALAAYDVEPREPTPRLVEAFDDLGALVERELFLADVGSAQQQLLAKLDISRRQALLDELTRLWNRRGGLHLLERALATARSGHGVGVCMIDIDHFKSHNDRHGHTAGDQALRKVAALLADSIRPGDVACRLGGDEFLLVFPDVSAEAFAKIVERIRSRTEALRIRTRSSQIELTLSLGGVTCGPLQPMTVDEILHRADDALYQAKAAGRNNAFIQGAA